LAALETTELLASELELELSAMELTELELNAAELGALELTATELGALDVELSLLELGVTVPPVLELASEELMRLELAKLEFARLELETSVVELCTELPTEAAELAGTEEDTELLTRLLKLDALLLEGVGVALPPDEPPPQALTTLAIATAKTIFEIFIVRSLLFF